VDEEVGDMRAEVRRLSAYVTATRHRFLDDRTMRDELADQPADDRCGAGARDGSIATVPVVLVHGYLARKTCWLPTIRHLRGHGLGHLRTATYNVFHDGVEQAARRVHDKVQRVADEHDVERVHVVGHSMGGIATLYAASHYGLDDRLASVVTLGSPYRGAPLARLAPAIGQAMRTARQLAPGSALLEDLRDRATELDLPWTSLWSRRDELVPVPAAQLAAARNVETAPVGHAEMLLSTRVATSVLQALKHHPAAGALGPTGGLNAGQPRAFTS
jgi:pimeloyl-ACP methyl ester carboxylesterase